MVWNQIFYLLITIIRCLPGKDVHDVFDVCRQSLGKREVNADTWSSIGQVVGYNVVAVAVDDSTATNCYCSSCCYCYCFMAVVIIVVVVVVFTTVAIMCYDYTSAHICPSCSCIRFIDVHSYEF